MEGFVRFIVDIVESGRLARRARPDRALLPIASGTDTSERIVEHLAGLSRYGPVRIGNAAVTQRQNDIYGRS